MGRNHVGSLPYISLFQLHPLTQTIPNYTRHRNLENVRQSMETTQRSTSRPTRSFKPIKHRTKQTHPQVLLPTKILLQRNWPTPSCLIPCHRPPSVNNAKTPLAAGTRRSSFLAQRDPWWYHAPCPFTLLILQHLITYMYSPYKHSTYVYAYYNTYPFIFSVEFFPHGCF